MTDSVNASCPNGCAEVKVIYGEPEIADAYMGYSYCDEIATYQLGPIPRPQGGIYCVYPKKEFHIGAHGKPWLYTDVPPTTGLQFKCYTSPNEGNRELHCDKVS